VNPNEGPMHPPLDLTILYAPAFIQPPVEQCEERIDILAEFQKLRESSIRVWRVTVSSI
jgi:hypothetical protein